MNTSTFAMESVVIRIGRLDHPIEYTVGLDTGARVTLEVSDVPPLVGNRQERRGELAKRRRRG